MGKHKTRMTDQQLAMLELRAQGKTFAEIGTLYGMTLAGARVSIRDAAVRLLRHGANAFPLDRQSEFTVDELINSVPSAIRMRQILADREAEKNRTTQTPAKDEKGIPADAPYVSVKTPFGDIYVSVKADPDYPGVCIDLKGPDVNETFESNTVSLAMIEFEPTKNKIQTVVYGNGQSEEPTQVIEHKNVLKREIIKPDLTTQIHNASEKAASSSRCGVSREMDPSR